PRRCSSSWCWHSAGLSGGTWTRGTRAVRRSASGGWGLSLDALEQRTRAAAQRRGTTRRPAAGREGPIRSGVRIGPLLAPLSDFCDLRHVNVGGGPVWRLFVLRGDAPGTRPADVRRVTPSTNDPRAGGYFL